ncbi:MAG: M48 family metallopeptidase [Micromonosporaceae bacterium]|nr:M48 family metallopeptidase [Micromonosporaceae bacterium]
MARLPMTIVVRAAVAVGLLAGFYLVAFGSVIALAVLSVWLWWVLPGATAYEASGSLLLLVVGLCLPLWRLIRARPQPPPGVPVTGQDAPQLWSLVRELAGLVGTRAPDEIRLVGEPNAMVWEDAGLVGLHGGRRYLYLGVPIMETLRVSQLRVVVAHELGHYARGHTRLSAVTYRGLRSIVDTIGRLGKGSLVGLLFSMYAAGYAFVALSVTRRMEVEADRAAVRAAGREVFTFTIRDIEDLVVAWVAYLRLHASAPECCAPATFLDRFRELVDRRAPELRRAPSWLKRPPPRWDSHPPMAERIALQADADDAEPPASWDRRPGFALIKDHDLLAEALRLEDLAKHFEWVARRHAEDTAMRLYRRAGGRTGGLGTVLDLLDRGQAAELATRSLPDTVLAAVGSDLVRWSGAKWRHTWSEPMDLVDPAGEPIGVRELVVAACDDPGAVPRLREFLAEAGVPELLLSNDPDRLAPGALPDSYALLLPDELYLLAHPRNSGRGRVPGDVLAAALAAATLAELRWRGRLAVDQTGEASLYTMDTTPTGDPFLDAVLERVERTGPRPAYRWLQLLGPELEVAVRRRVEHREPGAAAVLASARLGMLRALRSGQTDGRDMTLGMLLWGVELSGRVLGRRALLLRFWLGRHARRDPLVMAIRTVMSIGLPTPEIRGAGPY